MRRHFRGRGDVLIVLGMTGVILTLLSYIGLKIYFKASGIRPGVHFLGYDLTGLKVNDAATRIGQIVDWVYGEPVYLKFQNSLWLLRAQKHFKLQVDPTVLALEASKIGEKKSVYQQLYDWLTLNYPKVEIPFSPALDRKFTQTNVAARLSKIASNRIYARPLAGTQVELTYESKGASIDAVMDALEASFRKDPLLERRVVDVVPRDAATSRRAVPLFDPKYGFTVVLATKSSVVESADPSTFDNIVLACQRISGVMLNPGDIFSFNRVVGERTIRGGFKASGSRRAVGIGVGQLSSTMYEPVLRVGAKILERHRHVFWYPELKFTSPGLDAAVTDGNWDLRFQNETDLPLLLLASLKADRLTFEIRSVQEPPFKIELHPGKPLKIPFKTDWVKDTRVRSGDQRVDITGIEGMRVRTYRTWFTREESRKEKEELVSDDEYQRRNAVVRVNPGFVPPPEPKAEPPKPQDEPDFKPVKKPPKDEEEPAQEEPAAGTDEEPPPTRKPPAGDPDEPATRGQDDAEDTTATDGEER
ncbi:MAG: VanW family protein [Candidatus Riflebacteria bacterium]|nr:VanW family protein [Candidatus Riflebacteria bacterium]